MVRKNEERHCENGASVAALAKAPFLRAIAQPTAANWAAFVNNAEPFAISEAKHHLPAWSHGAAQIVADNALLKAIHAAKRFDTSKDLVPWLATIVRNETVNLLRAEAAWTRLLQNTFGADSPPRTAQPVRNMAEVVDYREPTPLENMILDEERQAQEAQSVLLRAAIDDLSEQERTVVLLRLRGIRNPEIGRRLGVTSARVATIYFRTTKQLTQLFQAKSSPIDPRLVQVCAAGTPG